MGGATVDTGAPATGNGVMPSSWSMVERRCSVADARSPITAENWTAIVPDGVGVAMAWACADCALVALTASSSPCSSWARAVNGSPPLVSVGALAINVARAAPVRFDAWTTLVASVP